MGKEILVEMKPIMTSKAKIPMPTIKVNILTPTLKKKESGNHR